MPFETIDGSAVRFNREESLPTTGFRAVNGSFSTTKGTEVPVVEPLVIAGGDLRIDPFIVRTMGEGQRARQVTAQIKSIAHTIAHKVIKGDATTAPEEFNGLQVRCTGDQLIGAGNTSGGDPLSLSGKMDEAIDACSQANALIMSRAMRRRFTQAARNTNVGGHIEYTTDAFGRQQVTYAGLPILEADPDGAVFKTLDFNEAGPGGGSTSTSIYVVSFAEGMLTGIQSGPPQPRAVGENTDKPELCDRVEWDLGLAEWHKRAAVRIWGISDAAIVA